MRIAIILFVANICSAFYDKITNREITLRLTEVPFYSSNQLYSSHYSKLLPIDNNKTKK